MAVAVQEHEMIRGKTEQRVSAVIEALRSAPEPLTYAVLVLRTNSPYDVLIYILATLCEVGLVRREDKVHGPGRPCTYFAWVGGNPRPTPKGAQALGA